MRRHSWIEFGDGAAYGVRQGFRRRGCAQCDVHIFPGVLRQRLKRLKACIRIAQAARETNIIHHAYDFSPFPIFGVRAAYTFANRAFVGPEASRRPGGTIAFRSSETSPSRYGRAMEVMKRRDFIRFAALATGLAAWPRPSLSAIDAPGLKEGEVFSPDGLRDYARTLSKSAYQAPDASLPT